MSNTTYWHPRWAIRIALEEKGMKQKELAQRLGWAESRISKLLGGEQTMSVDDLIRIARVLDRDVALFFKPPPNPDGVSPHTAPLGRQTVNYGHSVRGVSRPKDTRPPGRQPHRQAA